MSELFIVETLSRLAALRERLQASPLASERRSLSRNTSSASINNAGAAPINSHYNNNNTILITAKSP